jgi:hypothetical protein
MVLRAGGGETGLGGGEGRVAARRRIVYYIHEETKWKIWNLTTIT